MEYKDIFESVVKVVESKDKKSGFLDDIEFPWGRSDVFNNNHRYYPHKTFTSAVNELNTRIGKANVPGQVDHPLGSGGTRLGDVSHILTKVWMDENKVAWARASILDTQKGRDTLQIIKSGVPIGASLRGFGEVDSSGKIKPGFQVKTVDLVVDPSFGADARVDQSSVIESYIAEEKYKFNEDDLTAVTNALDELSDEVVGMVQEKLKKSDHIEMTKGQIKVLPIWIRISKDDPNIAPFHEWFVEQQKKFRATDLNFQEEINDGLRRDANFRNEERMAGSSRSSANTMYSSRKQIEQRQREIDQALVGSRHDAKTITRLFAEYVLAGGKLSRVEYIKEFGF